MIFRGSYRKMLRRGYPILTPLLRDMYRTKGIVKFGFLPLTRAIVWYITSKEYTNFTYDISTKCKKYLVDFLANVFVISRDEVMAYIREIEEDMQLENHFFEHVSKTTDRYFADLPIKYGRRIGWYAILRVLKPRIVTESGIDRGIGTCVLAAAMLRNNAEGHDGKIIALDINPYAGQYVSGPYSVAVEIIYGDSLEFLKNTTHKIDVFIHDSDHSAKHESQEYELAGPKLSQSGVMISDNADVTDCLHKFAYNNGLCFNYWQEEVVNHVASPGSIAIAMRRL